MTKNTKIVAGVILGIAAVVLIALVANTLIDREPEEIEEADTVSITRFDVEEGNFIVEGSGFSEVEIIAELSNIQTPESLGTATLQGGVWVLPVPEEPMLIERLTALAYDEAGTEVARRDFAARGVPEIYGSLYLDAPVEEVELGIGDKVEVNGTTVRVIELVRDTPCERAECRDGRDAALRIGVTTAGNGEVTGLVRSTDNGTPIEGYFVSLVDIEPDAAQEIDEDSYVITLAVSQDIKG